MKTICVDTRLLGYSGIGSYLKHQLPLLQSMPVHWVYIVRQGTTDSFPFLQQGEVIETTIPVFSTAELLTFDSIIPPCDLFWAPHFNSSLRRPRTQKLVVTYHDAYHKVFYDSLAMKEKVYTRFLLPHFLRRATRCITVSDFSKTEIIRFFPKLSSPVVIHSGIDQALFSRSQKKSLPLPTERPFFFGIGSIKAHKNFGRLLSAFAQTLDKHGCDLIVCGSAQGLRNSVSFSKLVTKHPTLAGRVHQLEHIDDETVAHLYRNAVGFVFPSLYEGFGLPPLEAMASGCPTAVAKAASIPEVCGDATLYFDPYDTTSISNALVTLAQDSTVRDSLQAQGIARAAHFTWQRSADAHASLFESLL